MIILAKKYLNRLDLAELSIGINVRLVNLLLAVLVIIYSENLIAIISGSIIALLMIYFTIKAHLYNRLPNDLLTSDDKYMYIHHTSKRKTLLLINDLLSVSPKKHRKPFDVKHGTLIIHTTSKVYKVDWIADVMDAVTQIESLIYQNEK